MGDEFQSINSRVMSLQYNAAGLVSLLGGDDSDRQRFLEIWKGITTPAEFTVVENMFEALNRQVQGIQQHVQAVQELATGIQSRTQQTRSRGA